MISYCQKKAFLLLLILSFVSQACNPDDDSDLVNIDILDELQGIEGATVLELDPMDHFNRIFEIKFLQPVDHQNPDGPKFEQKIYIGHVDINEPVILETEGYARSSFKTRKLAALSLSNQISVEHRYYGESIPSDFNWNFPFEMNYLTVKQAADDMHRVVMALNEIYKFPWVSSGRSKGGATAVYHRRFYPNDVVGTVPIVAPLLFAREDPRYEDYFNTVGTSECRQKVKDFQRGILLKLDELPTLMDNQIDFINANYNTDFIYTYPNDFLIRHAIIEYSYSFWRSTTKGCDDIPGSNSSAEKLFEHLTDIVDVVPDYTNWGVEFWRPYYYQSITETGETGYPTEHIDDLLGSLDPFFSFESEATFDPATMADINQWVQNHATDIVFIYGEEDPWTHAAYTTENNANLLKLIAPNAKHEATVELLTDTDRQKLADQFFKWTGKNI